MKADFEVVINVPFSAGPKRGKPRADKLKTADPPPIRPPRIATLMALAIHMDQLLRDGHVKDQLELAKLAGVTRARVTQVMGLLELAPDIQEQCFSPNPRIARARGESASAICGVGASALGYVANQPARGESASAICGV